MTSIDLYAGHWWPAAHKTYLKLGYVPLLLAPEDPESWRAFCAQLPFTPGLWQFV